MNDQEITILFNEIYDKTYIQIATYVTRRCDDPTQISDILQEIYVDIYSTIASKRPNYIENPEGFVQHVTKKKLARYYNVKSRLSRLVPFSHFFQGQDEQLEVIADLHDDISVESLIESRLLLSEISKLLAKKPTDIQRIFQMYYALDLPIRQVAIELNLNESTVKTKLYRTLCEIRKAYRKGEV